jgi:hypothetical protein
MSRQPKPRSVMQCPGCGNIVTLYVYSVAVGHRCTHRQNKWVQYVEVEVGDEDHES